MKTGDAAVVSILFMQVDETISFDIDIITTLLTEKVKMCIKFLKNFFALGKTIFNIV